MYQRLLSWIIVGLFAIAGAVGSLLCATAAQFNYPVVRPVALGQASFDGNETTDQVDLLLLLENWLWNEN